MSVFITKIAIICLLCFSCRSSYEKVYVMDINCDTSDISAVLFIKLKGDEPVALPLAGGLANITLDEAGIEGAGSMDLIFKSRTYDDIKYTDSPVSVGRHLKVNCYNWKIVIQVVSSGYL